MSTRRFLNTLRKAGLTDGDAPTMVSSLSVTVFPRARY